MKLFIAAAVLILLLPAVTLGSGPTRPAVNRRPVVRRQVQVEHRPIYGGPIRYHIRSWYFSWNRPD